MARSASSGVTASEKGREMTVVSAGKVEVVQVDRPKMASVEVRETKREGREGEVSLDLFGTSDREDDDGEDSPCLISKEGWMKVPLDSSQERRVSEEEEDMARELEGKREGREGERKLTKSSSLWATKPPFGAS